MQPLSTKLVLQKKKAKEGKSKYEIERDFEAPSEVTIQRRDFSQEEEDERDVLRQKFMEVGQFTSEYQTLKYILHWVDCNCRAWIFFSC
jgi:hypothetical protein